MTKVSKSKIKHKPSRILIANGVNLDLLGTREPQIYGASTLSDLQVDLLAFAKDLHSSQMYPEFMLEFFQTNDEAELLARISENWDGCVINPGAWTHTSLALADRLKGLGLKYVEVHISNTLEREEYRRKSFTAAQSVGVVLGAGIAGYRAALVALLEALLRR